VLCEIQQNSDVTYRLWDYGRPREIHVEQAVPISDLGPHPGAATPKRISEGREELVRCSHFITELVRMRAGDRITPEPQMSQLWIGLDGCAAIGGEPFRRGEVWLLPETGSQPEVRAESDARFLRTYVPAARR
jgi:mannose-6-phosphate isomerase